MATSWFLEKMGVLDLVAPLSESNELVLAIQAKDMQRCINALQSEPSTSVTSNKCSPLHLAAQVNFPAFMEYCLDNQVATVSDEDENGDSPLHYAVQSNNAEPCAFLVSRGADVLKKNRGGRAPYDLATNLNVRQYLLPIQLQVESERGLAPELPGATTAKSLNLEPNGFGPPPPPPPPRSFAPLPSGPPLHPPPGAPMPSAVPNAAWQPPRPDGFKSSASSSCAPKGPPQPINPPGYNQYSAFNAQSVAGGGQPPLGGRYVAVAYGGPPADPMPPQQPPSYSQTPYAPPAAAPSPVMYQAPLPSVASWQAPSSATAALAPAVPVAVGTPPVVAPAATKDSIIARLNAAKAAKAASAASEPLSSPNASHFPGAQIPAASSPPGAEGDLEEVNLNTTSSSVM